MAGALPLVEHHRGDTTAIILALKDEDGDAIDLTGYTDFKLGVSTSRDGDAETDRVFTVTGSIHSASDGKAKFTMSLHKATQLTVGYEYFFDVQCKDASGETLTWGIGRWREKASISAQKETWYSGVTTAGKTTLTDSEIEALENATEEADQFPLTDTVADWSGSGSVPVVIAWPKRLGSSTGYSDTGSSFTYSGDFTEKESSSYRYLISGDVASPGASGLTFTVTGE